ncbi:putative heme iron utilization protein [Chryseobacterium bernardetii]|uniref:Heme iron utilization protein n=1 Tax=Chryseobacterium bernardetii TaxID=1241978 RepID=A0ACC6IR50_9FLAO|nr:MULTISPECIES: pyridoxamine 5'-phosphate oxidase family protein [Chryseobacterium]MDR6368973.1 putative heme iron utilization protein [Chryseobacterium vietnamense]MDR6440104.1 putative heme iron utilization protein [Chryseobacterium bernardetii]
MNQTHTEKKIKPVAPKVQELINSSKSIILATVDAEGNPNSSYAPFVQVEQTFYILVSFMAKHTKNLADGRKTSIMFIEDESATKQIYARERLTIEATTSQIDRDSEVWNTVVAKLKENHGKVVDVISEMGDFILIALQPVKGPYVNGFGSAYFVDANLEIVEHRNDVNHQSK